MPFDQIPQERNHGLIYNFSKKDRLKKVKNSKSQIPRILKHKQKDEIIKDNENYDIEFSKIPEFENSLVSFHTDDINEISPKHQNMHSIEVNEFRPKAATIERASSQMIITLPEISKRTQIATKRIKQCQKSFNQNELEELVIVEEVEVEENQDINVTQLENKEKEKSHFDSKFDFKFDNNFLKSKQVINPKRVVHLIQSASNLDQNDTIFEETESNLTENNEQTPPSSKIDFNFFNFFNRQNRNKGDLMTEYLADQSNMDDEQNFARFGDDWLLQWCILRDFKQKQCENVFVKFDTAHKGYLIGDQLLGAIEAISKLDNLKLNYLFSVLKLCDADPLNYGADLKHFAIICALANRIKYLDDDWFKNMLPNLDLSTVENKVFKVMKI